MSNNNILSFEEANNILYVEVRVEAGLVSIVPGTIDLNSSISHVVWWCDPTWRIVDLHFDQGSGPFLSLGHYSDQTESHEWIMIGSGNTGTGASYPYNIQVASSSEPIESILGTGTVTNSAQSEMPDIPIVCKPQGGPPYCTPRTGTWAPGEEGSLSAPLQA